MPEHEKILQPLSEKDQGIAGWRHQRRQVARERAEAAQLMAAITTGRKIRGGTYIVPLPREYSGSAEHGATLDEHGRQLVEVTLPREVVADPVGRWTARGLLAAANREAGKARRTIRPRPSREAASDAAAWIVCELLAKHHGQLPPRDSATPSYLWTRTREAMIAAATYGDHNARQTAEDAGPLPDPASVAEQVTTGGLRRAAQDTDPMLTIGTDPAPSYWRLTGRERVAAAHAAGLMPGPEAADALGVKPSSVRVYLQRGRDKLRREGIRVLADRVQPQWHDERDDQAELAALMQDGPAGPPRKPLPWPERTDDGITHPVRAYRGFRLERA